MRAGTLAAIGGTFRMHGAFMGPALVRAEERWQAPRQVPWGKIAITVARGAIVLPKPLASIAVNLHYQRISNGDVGGWLLPGRNPARTSPPSSES
jgi:hypothetical protein